MKLIINADDYGITSGVSKGIIEVMKHGVLSDTTAMANMPFFEEAMEMAKENDIFEMGIHLTASCGSPVLPAAEVSELVNEDGTFLRRPKEKLLFVDQVENEFRAQIDKFMKTGIKLNHIDSHHHCYSFFPEVLKMVVGLAKEYNVPMRCPNNNDLHIVKEAGVKVPDYFVMDFYEDNVTEEFLIERLKGLNGKYEVVEIMAHPAIVDQELINLTSYNTDRAKESEVLKSEKVKKFIKENNIEVIGFSAL